MNGIKYFRLIRGMKAITLAEKTGLSIGTIKNMEKLKFLQGQELRQKKPVFYPPTHSPQAPGAESLKEIF